MSIRRPHPRPFFSIQKCEVAQRSAPAGTSYPLRARDGSAQKSTIHAIRSLTLSMLLLLTTAARAADAPASPQTTFFHANALYKDGQYAAAAKDYEQLLQSGAVSGNV